MSTLNDTLKTLFMKLAVLLREGAVVTLFETKTTGIQLKKRVTALKFEMTFDLKRYNVEL